MSTDAVHPQEAAISALKVNTDVTRMADVESLGIKRRVITEALN